jgi:hypothetical protein
MRLGAVAWASAWPTLLGSACSPIKLAGLPAMQRTEVNWASRPSNWVADPCFHPLSAQRPRFETLRPAWRIRWSDQMAEARSSFTGSTAHRPPLPFVISTSHRRLARKPRRYVREYMGKCCLLKSHQQVAPVARHNHPHNAHSPCRTHCLPPRALATPHQAFDPSCNRDPFILLRSANTPSPHM